MVLKKIKKENKEVMELKGSVCFRREGWLVY